MITDIFSTSKGSFGISAIDAGRRYRIMDRWENLPDDLLTKIEEILILYADKVRVHAVCKSWKHALPVMPDLKKFQLPWLLMPCNEAHESTLGLFNVLEEKTYCLDLPKNNRMLYRGSSFGWVVVLEGHGEIYLLNPLTEAKIQLPSRSKFPDVIEYFPDNCDDEYSMLNVRTGGSYPDNEDSCYILNHLSDKFFLSSDPSLSDDYIVVVIYGELAKLAYYKHGDDKWSSLPVKHSCFADVSFHNGRIHALHGNGQMEIIDIHPHPKAEDFVVVLHPKIKEPPYRKVWHSEIYLVDSSDKLLLVERQVKFTSDPKLKEGYFLYDTINFNVFQLDGSSLQWCRVTDIGDDVLFIGSNTAVSMSSLEFPGLKRSSVYFTDNLITLQYKDIQGGSEIGVFDLNSRNIEPLSGYRCDSNLVTPSPIWIIPNQH